MRLSWFTASKLLRQRAGRIGRRSAAAKLRVRQLERRRVLDGAATSVIVSAVATQDVAMPQAAADAINSRPVQFEWTSQAGGNEAANNAAMAQAAAANVPPVLVVQVDQSINEGEPLDLSGVSGAPPLALFIDTDFSDVHTGTVDWGDGSPTEATSVIEIFGSGVLGGTHTYADQGTFTVTVTVMDNNGGVASDTFTVVVASVAPAATLSNNGPVTEGDSATVTFTNQFDPSSSDTTAGFHYSYDFNNDGIWDVGDGSYGGSVTNASETVPASFLPNGPGDYTVTARILDKDGAFTDYTTIIHVNNAAPTLTDIVGDTINEDDVATIGVTIVDPSATDVFSVDVNWLDGSTASITGLGSSDVSGTVGDTTYQWTAATRQLQLSHQYLDDGLTVAATDTYNVSLSVQDSDMDSSGPYTAPVVVNNVPPTLVVATMQNVLEGDTLDLSGVGGAPPLGLYVDPGTLDTHTATVDWGDGSAVENATVIAGAGAGAIGGTHVYADDGTYTVTVKVTDKDGGSDTKTFTVKVGNVAPTLVVPGPQSVDEGSTLSITNLGTITDPGFNNPANPNSPPSGSVETFTYYINWGDGSAVDTGTATIDDIGGVMDLTDASFDGSHVYADDGTYTITVRVADDNMSGNFAAGVAGVDFVEQTITVTVKNVLPTLTVVGPQMVDEGSALSITNLGTITDPGFDDPNNPNAAPTGSVETFSYFINWGDGSATQTGTATIDDIGGVMDFTDASFDGSHTYADNGTYTVTVRVADDDMSGNFAGVVGVDFVEKTFTVTVNNVVPTLTAAGPQMVDEGSPLSITNLGTITDPGFDNPTNPNSPPTGSVETFTYFIDWGDGSATQTGTATIDDIGGVMDLTDASFDGLHTYADNGSFTITIRVADDDMSGNFVGGVNGVDFVEKAVAVTVKNVPPTLVVAVPQMVNESQELDLSGVGGAPPLGLYVDPGILDTHTATVNWGDGSATENATVIAGVGSGALGGTHVYADDGVYTVTVTVTDKDGASDTETFTVTVKNVTPTLTVVGPQMVDEGSALSITNLGTITDPGFDNPNNPNAPPSGSVETFTYFVNWGDGSATQSGAATIDDIGGVMDLTDASFDGSHTYADNGTYTVTVRVADDDMSGNFAGVAGVDFVEKTFTVTVKNVLPTLAVVGQQTIDEGSPLSITNLGTITDPGFDNPANPNSPPSGSVETFSYFIDWGDGTATQTGAATIDDIGGVMDLTDASFDGLHTYADNGTYTVRVRIADDDMSGNFAGIAGVDFVEKTFTVVVNNVDPVLTGTTGLTLDEGEVFTLTSLGVAISDPGFDNPNNIFDPANGGETTETFQVTEIDWGDGTVDTVTPNVVNRQSPTGGPTTADIDHFNHAYADGGPDPGTNYTVKVTLKDDDGNLVTRSFTILVKNVAPSLTLTSDMFTLDEGQTLSIPNLGSFTDPGFTDAANASVETYTYSINWGDGTTDTFQLPASVVNGSRPVGMLPGMPSFGTLANSHFYADNPTGGNTYTITVTISDDDGGSDTESFDITVFNVNPTLDPITATDVNSLGQTTLHLTFSDPGADSFTIMVDWGDGNGFVPEQLYAGPTPESFTIMHTYLGPPDPLNPAADIQIKVQIWDDDTAFAASVVEPGFSNIEATLISNPGAEIINVAIDTTPQVPKLEFVPKVISDVLIDQQTQPLSTLQTQNTRIGTSELVASSDRYLELVLISPDGEVVLTYRLKDDALSDLRGLFATLPDGHYKIYLVRTDNNSRRLVMDVFVRRGRIVDPTDDSEGTRDRPPTEDGQQNQAQPQDNKPAVEQVPEQPQQGAMQTPQLPVDGVTLVNNEPAIADEPPSPTRLRWAVPLAGIGLAAQRGSWAREVDAAFDKADDRAWKRLRRAGRRRVLK